MSWILYSMAICPSWKLMILNQSSTDSDLPCFLLYMFVYCCPSIKKTNICWKENIQSGLRNFRIKTLWKCNTKYILELNFLILELKNYKLYFKILRKKVTHRNYPDPESIHLSELIKVSIVIWSKVVWLHWGLLLKYMTCSYLPPISVCGYSPPDPKFPEDLELEKQLALMLSFRTHLYHLPLVLPQHLIFSLSWSFWHHTVSIHMFVYTCTSVTDKTPHVREDVRFYFFPILDYFD